MPNCYGLCRHTRNHNQSPIRLNPKMTHSNDIFESVPTCNPLFIITTLTQDVRMEIGATNYSTKGLWMALPS
jgi:hypothetical protein